MSMRLVLLGGPGGENFQGWCVYSGTCYASANALNYVLMYLYGYPNERCTTVFETHALPAAS